MSESVPLRVLVCGGRDFTDAQLLANELDALNDQSGPIDMIIHGGAPGADTLAGEWAVSRKIHVARVDALWERYGNRAGPVRNTAMLSLEPDVVVAFPGGAGTKNMVDQAVSHDIHTYCVLADGSIEEMEAGDE